MIYRYRTGELKIAKIEERFTTVYVSGVGKDAMTEQRSTGWWVVTAGRDPLAIQAGPDKPSFAVGDSIDIFAEVSA